MHPLQGRKQTAEHISRRIASLKQRWAAEPRKRLDIRTKLLTKIAVDAKGCWVWTGAVFRKPYGSYGQLRMENRCVRAHRISYETFVGPIPEGLELDHLCHNTLCINPAHLEPVTHHENMQRRKDSNQPHCKHGHLYTPETTHIRSCDGVRECRICMRARSLRYYYKHKSQ